MNKIQLFSEKATYASPSSKLIVLHSVESILTGSGDSDLYGGSNQPGNVMEDDDEYTYNF